jgi:hypothetical protein
MLDILRDPIWQFTGVIIAIAGSLLTLALFVLDRRRKEFTYTVAVNETLVRVAEELEGDLQITFKGQPVRGLKLLILELVNTGNVPILPSDYIKHPSIIFNDEVKVLSAEIAETDPKEIDAGINFSGSLVTFKLGLLNPRDYIRVKILVSNHDSSEISGRIAGVKRIKQRERRAELLPYYYSALILGLSLSIIGFFVISSPIGFLLVMVAIMIFLLLPIVIIRNARKYEKRVRQ